MSCSVQFDSDARLEFLDAIDWYNQERFGLGAEFCDEVDLALNKIALVPDAFACFSFSTRRYLLARFPYCLVYKMIGDVIWIVAVAHTSRRPGYWKERF
jgi:toxin ParE1/3/4